MQALFAEREEKLPEGAKLFRSRLTRDEQLAILDDIAWPKRAKPEFSQGAAFFTRFRDLTASGFFSSVFL